VQYITDNVLKKPFLLFELENGIDIAVKMAKWYEAKLVGESMKFITIGIDMRQS
jgi:hypothetical protein